MNTDSKKISGNNDGPVLMFVLVFSDSSHPRKSAAKFPVVVA